MASCPVEVLLGIPGISSLTLDLYPFGSDTASFSAASFTEATNRLGLYTATVTDPTTGMYQAFVKNGSAILFVGDVYLTNDTTIHRIGDQSNVATSQIVVKKNVAFNNFAFFMSVTQQPSVGKTGLTWASGSAQVNIDSAGFVNLTNYASIQEIGSGLYIVNLAAVDVNGNVITLKFTGTGADTRILTILTQL